MGLKSSRPGRAAAPSATAFAAEDWPWVWAIRNPEILDWKRGLSKEAIQSRALQQQNLPVAITENLCLGNAACVQDLELLKLLQVTAVLNMAEPLALRPEHIQALKAEGIQYKGIASEDDFEYMLLEKHWEEALEFLELALRSPGAKCLVHCVAGMNRSALIVSAYFMLKTKTPVIETVRHVRLQRGNLALQNEGFQEQLVDLARKHDLLGAAPGTAECSVDQLPPTWRPEYDWRSMKAKANPLDQLF